MTIRRLGIFKHPLILPFYLPALLIATSEAVLFPVLPLYVKALESSYGLIGLMLAGEGLGLLLGDIPSGLLLRHLGQKHTMLLGTGCMAVSVLALAWCESTIVALLLRLIAGLGASLYGVARHAYIAEAAATASRGRSISLLGGLFRAGRLIGPLLGGTVATAWGLRAAFVAFSLLQLGALLLIVRFVPAAQGRRLSVSVHAPRRPLWYTIKARWRVLTAAGLGQVFAQTIRAGRPVIIPLYAADVLGMDVQAIGLLESIASTVDMAIFYPAGWIMDRWGRKWAVVPCFAIQAIGMALVPLTGTPIGLLLAMTIISLGNGLGSGIMLTIGADLAPSESRGEFLGLWRFIGDGGSSGGPLIVGWVADLVALPTAAWAMAAAGLISAAIFALFVPETLVKTPHQALVQTSPICKAEELTAD
ncbi:MAG: MFS transporter [Anaerolineae bacterium]|nr:MFS transporter [Anaerolineae bacterium]